MGKIRDIIFDPGVVKDDSLLAAARSRSRRRWADSDRIRFVGNYPQKVGGWGRYSANTFTGMCRGALAWMDGSNNIRLGLGTHKKLMVMEADTIQNITPARASGTMGADPFTTTNGSTTVTVVHAGHGFAAGDYVEFDGAAAVGGITPDGNYEIASVVDVDTYTIAHTSAASSAATGGGASVTYVSEISIGRADGAQGTGYGVGAYGAGTWGTARTVFILFQPRVWSLDQWGVTLLAMPTDGNLYQWSNDIVTRALLVSGAPTSNTGFFVTEEKHIVVLDAGGTKMKVQWNDQDSSTEWSVSDQTTAGSRNLQGGTKMLQGIRTSRTNLLLSDAAVWTMTFIGGEDTFGFDQVAAGAAGGISPHCAVEVDGTVYWMGKNDFYQYDGTVRRVRNSGDIRRFVFDNISSLQGFKCHAVYNSLFKEIWWFYATAGEIDRYVKVNLETMAWDVGSLARTSGVDLGLYGNPLWASSDGYVYEHESGTDDYLSAMNEFIESAPFQIDDGNRVVDINSFLPDFQTITGDVLVSLLTREYPQASEVEESISTITSATETADMRGSGRQAQIRVTSTTTSAHWRLGVPKLDVSPGGER